MRTRPGQGMGDASHFDLARGDSLPGGGPAALWVVVTRLGRWRGAKAPRDQCHHWTSMLTIRSGGYRIPQPTAAAKCEDLMKLLIASFRFTF
jgi:hypothetical protein